MPAPSVEFHPEAIAEAHHAVQWYLERSKLAAAAFVSELDLAVEHIQESPDRWSRYVSGTQRYLFHRFPYYVVYRQVENVIQVVAIAHGRRRPGYWKSR
jgi:plasmid stabilization system protein ParE